MTRDINSDLLNVTTNAAIAIGGQTTIPVNASSNFLGSRKKPIRGKEQEAKTGEE